MLVPYMVSALLGTLALFAFRLSWQRMRGRRRFKATVVSLSVGAAKAGEGYGISPIFEYADDNGHVVRASCVHHGRHALMPKLGDEVDIYVDPRRPFHATLERPGTLWLAPSTLAGMAGLFFYMGLTGR